jgi:hypothetical protein
MSRCPGLVLTAAPLSAAVLLVAATSSATAQQQPAPRQSRAGVGYGFDAPAGTPLTPHGRGGAGMIPPVERQYDAARRAGGGEGGGSIALLRAADRALEGGDTGLANEYLERAATALLNQPGVEAGPAGVRSVGPGYHINEARAALARHDLGAARRGIREAAAAVRRADGDATASGADALPAAPPTLGGGGGAGVR